MVSACLQETSAEVKPCAGQQIGVQHRRTTDTVMLQHFACITITTAYANMLRNYKQEPTLLQNFYVR